VTTLIDKYIHKIYKGIKLILGYGSVEIPQQQAVRRWILVVSDCGHEIVRLEDERRQHKRENNMRERRERERKF
jgi:hypothetical protein